MRQLDAKQQKIQNDCKDMQNYRRLTNAKSCKTTTKATTETQSDYKEIQNDMKGKNDYKQIQNYFKERLNDFPFNNPLLFKLETTKHLLKELGPHYLLLLFSHLSDFLDLSVNCLAC